MLEVPVRVRSQVLGLLRLPAGCNLLAPGGIKKTFSNSRKNLMFYLRLSPKCLARLVQVEPLLAEPLVQLFHFRGHLADVRLSAGDVV